MNQKGMTRRSLLLGGAALGTGTIFGLRPSDEGLCSTCRIGSPHNEYFSKLSDALDTKHLASPSLVVDKALMEKNIETLKQHINGRYDYRIVAKSLPSINMLKWVMNKADTNKLMVFHQPFLSAIAKDIPDADVLMGKPMPINAVKNFYSSISTQTKFLAEQQLQWLVDSPKRLQQYADYAQENKRKLQINVEIDIGLHRGGVSNEKALIQMLKLIEASEYLNLSGFMGYEAHIGKVPGDAMEQRDEAMAIYESYLKLAQQYLQRPLNQLTLNCGGSTTYQYYKDGEFPFNELSAGSCIVKPADFDLASLHDHTPACFIATPVLKVLPQAKIPGVSGLDKVLAFWNQNLHKAFFTYGGYWKAIPESPVGLQLNPVYGRSSNQEMYNGSMHVELKQDDWLFLRPTQSEAVLLQFGEILVINKGEIVHQWPILTS